MGRAVQYKTVANSQIVTSSAEVKTTAPSPFQLTNPFPIGDLVYQSLPLRISGSLDCTTGGGTVNTDGGLQFIRQLYFSTPQHTMIVEGVDGILLHDMGVIKSRGPMIHSDAPNTTVSTSPAFEYFLELMFKDPEAYRFADQGIDVLRSGSPFLQLNLGVYTDFVTGGAAGDGVKTYNLETSLRLDPGPINVTDDAPQKFQPYLGVFKFPVTQTGLQQQIFLAFGDRIYKKIFVTQRNSSTLVRMANTLIGVNDTDRLSLIINSNFRFVDRVEWLALQDWNAKDYRLAAMPTGVGVLDFTQLLFGQNDSVAVAGGGTVPKNHAGQGGYKLSNALSVLSKNQGTLELDADLTTVSNGQIWVGYDAVKLLQAGAMRPAPTPQGAPSNLSATTGG
jgi:hypothetical protein